MKKATWPKIRREFKAVYPNLSKQVIHWRPYDFGKIVLFLKDGAELVYDYDSKRAVVLSERWKE